MKNCFYLVICLLMTQQAKTRDLLEKRTPKAPRMAPMPEWRPEKSEKVPAWIVGMFIFALAFCLFAVYKAFIYKQGYDFSFGTSGEVIEVNFDDTSLSLDEQGENSDFWSGLISESWATTQDLNVQTGQLGTLNFQGQLSGINEVALDRSKDVGVIENFYANMVANKFDEMNALVHTPLLRSKTWTDHWNAKNLGIFSRNLVGQLNLDNLFFISNSVNQAKKTRQYSYTLSYTIQPDHQYKEDWKITLITAGTGKVLISEIMCETKWCSRSPFFWPQNLGLK